MRVLALDVGLRRVGVAVSDPLGIIAQPLETIEVRGKRSTVDRIFELIDRYEVSTLVVGLPLSMRGHENESTQAARALAEAVRERRPELDIEFQDERFTSVEAERALLEGGVRRKKRKQVIDRTAATLILRGWLDAHPVSEP
jgi:putative Holliday junction resolvase